MTLYREAVDAQDLKAGDDVVSVSRGRFTVQSVERVNPAMVRVTSTRGLSMTVSNHQFFSRYIIKEGN